MAEIFSFAAFGVAIFALISEIISVSLEYWVYIKINGIERYSGLWKSCAESSETKVCSSDGGTIVNTLFLTLLFSGLLGNNSG